MNPIFNATWIKAKRSRKDAVTLFSRSCTPIKEVASATLSVTARGVFVATLNGSRIGEDILAPGWTVYQKRHQYLTYDVTPLLQSGENDLAVGVGKGWFFHKIPEVRAKDLKIDEAEMAKRKAAFSWKFDETKYPRFLNLFVKNVGSMAHGGIWE